MRRRFWERVLRAVDKAGTGGQLRNQLWVVYDAVKQTAEWPLGNVVSGAFIYDASIKSSALKSGTLLQEISETIARQKKEEDGELRYQICALIFLIGQLPHNDEPLDAGIRADAETLADLLVTDLTTSSAQLRKKVPDLLEKLVAAGAIMQVDDEYRMQTREGSEWNQTFLEARNKLLNDPASWPANGRNCSGPNAARSSRSSSCIHGESKESREDRAALRRRRAPTDGSAIPVWVRDGWEVEEKTVVDDARAAGDAAAVVYGYIPRKSGRRAEAGHRRLLRRHDDAPGQGDAGRRRGNPGPQSDGDPAGTVASGRGTCSSPTSSTRCRSTSPAATPSAACCSTRRSRTRPRCAWTGSIPCSIRPIPPSWHKVIDRARKGDGDALTVVGHKGDADEPPGLQGDPRICRQRQEGHRHPQAVRRSRDTAGPRTPSTPP